MRISQLSLATIATALGIYLGDAHPLGISYVLFAIALLLAAKLLFRNERMSLILSFLAWMTLSAFRANLGIEWGSDLMEHLQQMGSSFNLTLVQRLAKANLSPDALHLSSAMFLGNRANLPFEIRHLFNETGSSHLLAISGLHIGILFVIIRISVDLFVRFLPLQIGIVMKRYFPLVLIWIYAFITGMQPSVVRAATMLTICIAFFPTLHLRHLLGVRFMLCVFLMLWLSPAYAFQLGFWLSILALAAIVWAYVPFEEQYHLPTWNRSYPQRILLYFLSLLGVSFFAQLATTPLTLYYFHTLPLLGFLWNLITIPLTTLILIFTTIVLLVPHPIIGLPLNLISSLFISVQERMATVPYVVIHDLYPSTLQVILFYAILLVLLLRLRLYLIDRYGQ